MQVNKLKHINQIFRAKMLNFVKNRLLAIDTQADTNYQFGSFDSIISSELKFED